jgi:hypothetical protein
MVEVGVPILDDTGLIVGLKPPMIHMYNKVGFGFSIPVKRYKLGYLYWTILGSLWGTDRP